MLYTIRIVIMWWIQKCKFDQNQLKNGKDIDINSALYWLTIYFKTSARLLKSCPAGSFDKVIHKRYTHWCWYAGLKLCGKSRVMSYPHSLWPPNTPPSSRLTDSKLIVWCCLSRAFANIEISYLKRTCISLFEQDSNQIPFPTIKRISTVYFSFRNIWYQW